MKTTKISGIGFINKNCKRCKNGKLLICSSTCKKFIKSGHDHECPDCGRKLSIKPQI
jgi:hypothetical protein